MATRSSILAWKIPWTEGPGGYSPWGRKELDLSVHPHMHAVCVSPLKRQNTEECSVLCDPHFMTLCEHTAVYW